MKQSYENYLFKSYALKENVIRNSCYHCYQSILLMNKLKINN